MEMILENGFDSDRRVGLQLYRLWGGKITAVGFKAWRIDQ